MVLGDVAEDLGEPEGRRTYDDEGGLTHAQTPARLAAAQAEVDGAQAVLDALIHELAESRTEKEKDFLKKKIVAAKGAVVDKEGGVVRERGRTYERRLRLVGAMGLQGVDLMGKADPYAIVYWNNARVGETAVAKNTLEPSWPEKEATFSVRVRAGAQDRASPNIMGK